MALYMLTHAWKKEDFKTIGRKVIESMQGLPKGATMLFSYCDAHQTGAWCVYETENPDELLKYWVGAVPEINQVDIIPIIQFFPPGLDSYKLIHLMASL